ncbi:DUF418 domain-containing protein [Erythrobacter jejuensis]|uniref:DUF418 domain-containing protein n=2 Tax=Parerythrobacter jejuensis TaxID=795812 RepID=A0A845APZ3_9SPHN|nr:DUF418 domain-containing protein [Parerythrobacter jejuensis]
MGILAANIVAFGQPFSAYMYPDAFTVPHSATEDWLWVGQFVLIDSKMRGLFSLLFGAGMMLFMEKAWARGATRWLQARRLFWLGLFGLIHYFLIWRGDILFSYACCGMLALLFLKVSAKWQLRLGILGYLLGAVMYGSMMGFLYMASETDAARSDPQMAEMVTQLETDKQDQLADGVIQTELISSGDYPGWVNHMWVEHASDLGFFIFLWLFETLPLMLMGMALYRMGLFSGGFDPTKQRMWGWAGVLSGGALSLWLALWIKGEGLTFYGTQSAMVGFSFLPRVFMILGLAALLALYGPKAVGWLGERISYAGRAAFTNYLGTSIVMLFVFHGWALGLFGKLGRIELYGVMLLAWALMLLWSKPWLERFRYGPLEYLWRCLTYMRVFPLRK